MKVVIVGNGVAGVAAAQHLRELRPDFAIEILAREPYHHYQRPRLPEIIAGEVELADIIAHPPEWYASSSIEVRLAAAVESVLTDERVVVLEDGTRISYDALLIASGSDPFVPPVRGADRDGVFVLRTADDALAIREWTSTTDRAVVVGGGLLGLEAARALRAVGLDVDVLEGADRLLPRQLDGAGADVLESQIERLGIRVSKGVRVVGVEGSPAAAGVVLGDGTRVPGGLVLFAVGVRSTVNFLGGSPLHIGRGVVVDCDMRTNVTGVFAAGDAAEHDGIVWGIIPAALAHAEAAARTIAGDAGVKRCTVVPENTLKVAGVSVFSIGIVECDGGSCVEHVEADPGAGLYRKVVIREGKLVGASVVGSRNGLTELRRLIRQGVEVGASGRELARDDFDFRSFVSAL